MMEEVYIFMGGLPNHRRREELCTVHYVFDTDKSYCLVEFKENRDDSPLFEVCHLDNLHKQVD
jgi:hypothetical protein